MLISAKGVRTGYKKYHYYIDVKVSYVDNIWCHRGNVGSKSNSRYRYVYKLQSDGKGYDYNGVIKRVDFE